MPRNLISLVDGTMVSASQTSEYGSYSNIFELACLLQLSDRSADGSPQIVFYTSGISSQPDTSSAYTLLTGNSIKSQIVDQYTNICANFDFAAAKAGKPDKIYLFGFSRGAMAIRALCGLIAEFGLLEPRDIRHLPIILDRWDRSQGIGGVPSGINLVEVDIEFVGLFDSVMGGIERLSMFNPVRFTNSQMPLRCKRGIQILAIDENRGLFKPKPWQGIKRAENRKDARAGRYMRQIWMPGVHSDVGGTGNPTWGWASLLAMVFYLERQTNLGLSREWVAKLEDKLRRAVEAERHFINLHKRYFTNFIRRPSGEDAWFERRHPIGEILRRVNYNGREPYDWREKVLEARYKGIETDDDLFAYFDSIFRGDAPPVLTAEVIDAADHADGVDDVRNSPDQSRRNSDRPRAE